MWLWSVEVLLLVVFEGFGIEIVPIRYVVSERDTMEFNGTGYTRMEDRWNTTNKKTLSGKVTLHILVLHAKRRTQCDDVGMHAHFVQLHWFRSNAPLATLHVLLLRFILNLLVDIGKWCPGGCTPMHARGHKAPRRLPRRCLSFSGFSGDVKAQGWSSKITRCGFRLF